MDTTVLYINGLLEQMKVKVQDCLVIGLTYTKTLNLLEKRIYTILNNML